MSIEQDRDYVYLRQFLDSPDGSLKKLDPGKAKTKGLDLDPPAKKTLEAKLISSGYLTLDGKGPAKKYTLTDAGRQYFKTLPAFPPPPPPPPPPDPKLKGLVMLNLLIMGDGHLTLKQVKALATKGLGFSKDAIPSLLNALLQDHAIEQTAVEGPTADDRVRYKLTETGKRQVAHLRQHVDAVFKITGRTINQLLESAAGRAPSTESAPPHHQATAEPHQPAPQAAALTDDDLIRDARSLMQTVGRNGLLPIFELRRHIKKKFGERAASHEELDARLKRLRGGRLELISIQEQGHVTRDQADDGVKGLGELFFYVRNPR